MLENVDMQPEPPVDDAIPESLLELVAPMETADTSSPAATGWSSSRTPSAPSPPKHGASDSLCRLSPLNASFIALTTLLRRRRRNFCGTCLKGWSGAKGPTEVRSGMGFVTLVACVPFNNPHLFRIGLSAS